VQAVHGKHFSRRKWDHFVKSRAVPGSDVGFAEIEVMLCDIPSRTEVEDEQRQLQLEEEGFFAFFLIIFFFFLFFFLIFFVHIFQNQRIKSF
jgi:hypothetical protein